MSTADARAAAARIVGRVVREGAYSNVVAPVETETLDDGDRRAAHALAFEALRRLPAVDRAIDAVSKRPVARIDAPLLDLLRVGAVELGLGGRPQPLIVDSVVTAAKRLDPSYTGFANGVLRNMARRGFELDVDIPEWLRSELSTAMGDEEIDAFWAASLEAPSVGVRSPSDPGSEAVAVTGIDDAWLIDGAVASDSTVQDPASVAVGRAVEASPGERVLDIAAAPGGKTLQLVEAGAEVTACDVHPRRVNDAARRAPGARWLVADGRRLPFDDDSFDAVLLDGPCTGLGTLRRRPEIALKTDAADVHALADLGKGLLAEAQRVVRSGGRIIYSVCTVTPTETIDVVAGLGAKPPSEDLPGRAYGDGWLLAPHLGPTDGMFIARIDA